MATLAENLAAARAKAPAPGSTNFVLDSIANAQANAAKAASGANYYYLPGITGALSSASAPKGANLVRLSPYTSAADREYFGGVNKALVAGTPFSDPALQGKITLNEAVHAASPLSGLPGSFNPGPAPLYDRYPTLGLDPNTLEFEKDYKNGEYLPFMTNKGTSAIYQPEKLDPYRSSGVYLDPNAQYRIVDRSSGKELYSGAGAEGLKNTFALSQKLSADQGSKANWGVEMYDPNTKSWNLSAEDKPDVSELGMIASIGLPILGAIALPGIGGALGLGSLGTAGAAGTGLMGALGAAGTAGLGAALGSTISGIAQGQSFGDILKGAALSGLGTYVGGSLLGKLGSTAPVPGGSEAFNAAFAPGFLDAPLTTAGATLGSTAGSALGDAASSAFANAPLTVIANKALGSGLSAALAPAISAGAASLAPSILNSSGYQSGLDSLNTNAANSTSNAFGAPAVVPSPEELVVTANKALPTNAFNAAIPSLASTLPTLASLPSTPAAEPAPADAQPDDIVVTGAKAATPTFAEAFSPAFMSGLSSVPSLPSTPAAEPAPADEQPDDIVVTADKASPLSSLGPFSAAIPDLASTLPSLTSTLPPAATKPSTLSKIQGGLKLFALASGLLGGGSSGSGSGSGTVPGGFGTLNPIFSATLPTANMPGLSGTAGPRTAADLASNGLATDQDWYRYGYGPEQSFFTHVPRAPRNTSTAFTGYAEGGSVDDDTRLARALMSADRRYGPERHSGSRRPRVSVRGELTDEGPLAHYAAMLPLGDEGQLTLDARGGLGLPRDIVAAASHRLGSADLRASHTLGGGSEYGLTAPLLGGGLDLSAYAEHGLTPEGLRLAYSRRFERGGDVSDGRADDVPAMLSNGEYVMDAETVAMLGNGSNKAGAAKLDQFRVNIRKHKGRQLAKGAISANAKTPERYLAGGLA